MDIIILHALYVMIYVCTSHQFQVAHFALLVHVYILDNVVIKI
jgi:hypothetical protein